MIQARNEEDRLSEPRERWSVLAAVRLWHRYRRRSRASASRPRWSWSRSA